MITRIGGSNASTVVDITICQSVGSARLTELLRTLHYKTVERLAEHIAQTVLGEFHAPWVKVTVGKPAAVKNAALVGVVIERRAATSV